MEDRIRELESVQATAGAEKKSKKKRKTNAESAISERAAEWSEGPGWREVAIGIGGGIATGLVTFGATVYTIATGDSHARAGASYPSATYVVTIVTTLALVAALPRAFVPVPLFNTRNQWGSYDGGWRLQRSAWIMIACVALLVHAGTLFAWRPR